MNSQLLEYYCSECGVILKETFDELNQNVITASGKEECPKCGSIVTTLRKVWKQPPITQGLYNRDKNGQSFATPSWVPSSLSNFQIAYDEFIGRLMFDIKALDTSLQYLNNDDNTLAIIGNNNHEKYDRKLTNTLLTRLCIYSLFLRRQSGYHLSSSSSIGSPSHAVIIDAGNSLDFYQFVEFARQYGLDIKETLKRIVVSRAFTVYQLTDLVVNELPNITRRLDICLVVILDLLNMFTHDPNINHKEAKFLINEIISTLSKIALLPSRTRCAVSLNYNCNSSLYIKTLLKFDKCIEVKSTGGKQLQSTLSLRIYDRKRHRRCKNGGTSYCLLKPSDLYLVAQK